MRSEAERLSAVRISEMIAPNYYAVHNDIRDGGHGTYWFSGGRGSLKSSFVSIEIVLGLLRHPQANAIVYRRVQNTLRESVYEQMIWAIDRLGLRDFFSLRVSPMEIRYKPTGQRILFRGADDPTKSKSIKLSSGYFGYLWFEELAEFGGMEDIRTIAASVIRGGEFAQVFCSYNPPMTAGNWVNREALTRVPGRLVHFSDYTQAPREWLGEYFIAEAEALKKTNERAYRHMYLGEVTGTGGNVFDNLEIRTVKDEEFGNQGVYYNGLDFGFAVDPDAFVRWAYDKRTRSLIAVSEYYGARTPTDRLVEEIKRRAGSEVVFCDSADPRMIAELQQRGVRAVGAKKGPGSVEHGMRWLQDAGKIIIDPERTPNIAREFRGYEYQRSASGEFLSSFPDADNHSIDATRYALENVINQRAMKSVRGI